MADQFTLIYLSKGGESFKEGAHGVEGAWRRNRLADFFQFFKANRGRGMTKRRTAKKKIGHRRANRRRGLGVGQGGSRSGGSRGSEVPGTWGVRLSIALAGIGTSSKTRFGF